MQKKSFKILTQKDHDFIPWNVVIINDIDGWMFIAKKGTQWFVNSTQDNKDGEENEVKFLKKLVKALKVQMKTV